MVIRLILFELIILWDKILRHGNIEDALEKLKETRGNEWVQETIQQIETSPGGQRLNCTGMSGLIRFFEHYRNLLEGALKELEIDTVTIDTAEGRWAEYYRSIHSFLSLEESRLGLREGHAHLHANAREARSAELFLNNQTDRTVIAYECLGRQSQYAFILSPRQTETFSTTQGKRFRFHDVNSGEILQDLIAYEAHQGVTIAESDR